MKLIQMLAGFIHRHPDKKNPPTLLSLTLPIKSLFFILFTFAAGAQAETLSLVTYYGKTGGIAGDLNTTADKVNGVTICPNVNTNSNSVPGCDFSDDSGYQKNNVNDPTDDTYTGDLIVRNNDQFEVYAGWSITGGNEPVTITAVLPDNTLRWESLPSSCKTGSSLSEDGQTMVCVRSGYTTATAYSEDIPFNVVVKGSAQNGHAPGDVTITINSDNGAAKTDAAGVSIITTASPRWNLQKSIYTYAAGQTHNGLEGYITEYKYYLEVDEVIGAEDTASGVLGNESLGNDFTLEFDDDLSSVSPNAELVECRKDHSSSTDPYSYFSATYPERSVATPLETMVQTCTQAGGPGTTIHVKHAHIDASLTHIPTNTRYYNTAIPATRAIAAIGTIRVFIPNTDIFAGINATDIAGPNELATKNILTTFDPISISGQSNFGADSENTNDNSYARTLYGTSGSFSKHYTRNLILWSTSDAGDATGFRAGDGVITPGANWTSRVNYYSSGSVKLTGGIVCDIFDSNTVDVTDIPATPGQAIVVHYNTGGSDAETGAVYEYATGYVSGSWPPNPEADPSVVVAQECGDTNITWHATTTAARAVGPITKIRVRFTQGVPAGRNTYTIINLTARSNDLNGNPIPSGTIIPNYASVTDDNFFNSTRYPATNGWYPSGYQPKLSYDTPHSGGIGGDRILLVRGKARIAKSIAQTNVTTGEILDFTLSPTFTCDGTTVESSSIKVTEMMDPGLSYVAGSSSVPPAEPTIGSCADLEVGDLKTACTADHTVLVWDLGTKSCNTAIPAITFNTQVDAGAPVGTLHTYSMIQSPTDTSNVGVRTANQNLNISIPSALILTKTTIDNYFDAGDTLSYTVHSRNGTTTPLSNLDMIDILPFNGDGTDGYSFTVGTNITHQSRSPASDFEGAINFTQATTGASCAGTIAYRYTNKIPKDIDISPTADSNKPTGTTTWCDGTATGPGAACGFTNNDVTAIRVTGADLGPTAICSITITAQAPGHALDKFQQFSNTAGAYAQGVSLPTLSNVVSIAGQPPVTTPDNKTNPNAIAADNPTSQDVTLNDTHPVASVGINKSTINFIGGTDTDSDGDADQIIVANEGTWTVDANGIVTFTPLDGFTGTPSAVQYNVKANNGFISNTSAVTVSYTSPPVAVNDSQANPAPVAPTNPTTLTAMTGNDSDTDGTIDAATVDLDPTTEGIQKSFTNTDGTWVSDDAGNVTFTPNATLAINPQPINYTVNDNAGNTSNIATLTVTYGLAPSAISNEARNNNPVAADNPTVLTNITDNDSDPDGTIDTATIDLDPNTAGIQTTFTNADGTWEVTNTTDVTFTPNANLQDNPTPITYVVSDNDGNPTNTATLTIIYGKAPIAVDDKKHNPAPVSETNPTILSLIAGNDSDPDPQGSINVSSIDLDPATAGIQTTFSNAQGNWAVDALGNVTFTPDATLTTDPTPIDYTVNDNEGNTSNIAKLTVTYGSAPVAVNDIKHNPAPVSETNPTTLPTIASNDTDSDGTIDASTIDLDPATAGKQSTFTNGDGTWAVTPEGNVTFTPNATLATDPAVIPYTVEDNEGNTSNTATLTVTYGEAPVAVADSKHNPAPAAPENPTTLTAMTGNDSDPDGTIDPATVDLDPATAGIQNSLTNNDGTWTATPEGNVIFTPNATLSGNPQVINYTVNDNEGNTTNTATLTVTYGNAPVAVNDSQHNTAPVAADNPTTLNAMTGNDSDADGTIDPATVDLDPATAGIQSTFTNNDGTWETTPEGNVTFTPKASLTTDPTPINYVVSDNEGVVSNIATLTVTYGSAPVAVDDSKHNTAPVAHTNPTTLTAMTGNDTDSDGTIDPATVDLDPATAGIQDNLTNADGVWTVTTTGDVTFTPAESLTGNPTAIPYTVKDNEGNTSNTALLSVTYGLSPVATSNSAHSTAPVASDNPVLLEDITGNDSDPDGTIDPTTVDLDPAKEGIQKTFTNEDGTWTVTNMGDATFTPNAQLTHDPAPINYVVSDNEGNLTNIAQLTVIYGLIPLAENDVKHNTAPVASDNPTTLPLITENDSDPDGEISPATVDLDPSAEGIQDTLTNEDGVWTVTPEGNVTFTPNATLASNPTPINYTVNDKEGNTSNIATLTVTYGQAPKAVDDSKHNPLTVSASHPTTMSVITTNDSDEDGTIDPATVDLDPSSEGIQNTLTNEDGTWTVTPTGDVTFTPNESLTSDPQPIPYTVNDNDGNTSNTATLTITYGLAPIAEDDRSEGHTTTEAVTINPLTNDSDPDEGTLDPTTVVLTGEGVSEDGKILTVEGEGVWTVNPETGEITFTPAEGFTANPTPVTYTVNDNNGNISNEATVTITYVARPPVATDDNKQNTGVVAETNPTTLELVTANDNDPDGVINPASVDLNPSLEGIQNTLTNADGTWQVTPEGNVTFTPNASLSENPQPIPYTVNDNDGNTSNTATLTVTYGRAPIATDNEKLDQIAGTTVTLAVAADDSDPDNDIDPTSVKLIDANGNPVTTLVIEGQGTWTVNPESGDISFAPEPGYTDDPTPVSYEISDLTGKVSNQATVTVTYSVTASIIGTVWLDRNKNGEIDPNERRMPNWTLKVRDTEGNVIRTTTTDAQGNYAVEGLAPEEYTIEFYNEKGVMIASKGTNGPLQPTLPNARPFELLLPIDPSGVVYNSTTRQPVEGVQLQLQNSQGVAVDPLCVGPQQQNQVTGADGLYAFDVNPAAHATCPVSETYHIQIVRVPHNYHPGSVLIPVDTAVYQGAATEAGCTVDAIANSGSCEVQAQADAPTGNQSTRYFFDFELQPGDLNIIFNNIALDEVAGGDILIRKAVNKQQGSIGDMFFYTIDATNTTSFSNNNIDLVDNIPAGFALVTGSSKLIRAGADGKLGTKDDVRVNVTPIGTDPMTYNNIDFAGNEKLRITYMMRVGATAIEGKHVNTVQALNTLGAPASNTSKATVNIIAEATIDQSTLIGKVFHDRDGDGYQDAANITGISIKGNGYTKYAGGLTARVSTQDNPAKHSKVINVPWNNAGDNSFTVETQQGTRIQVDNAGNITEMHRGMKAKGLTGQQLQVNLRRAGDELEITLTNLGINEEGIPGVRLATVKGLVLETDGYGRYHIPDVDGGRRGFGKNFIIKVDKATLPKGSTFTTENPRVLRITGAALNKINFGVKLPGQEAAAKRQYVPAQYKTVTKTHQVTQQKAKPRTVSVNLGSIFFDKDKHHIRPDQRGTMDDIATKIQQYGHGHITIDAFTDARHNAKYNIALAERRANTVRKELHKRLGSRLMRNVKVDVDKSAYKEVPHNDPRAIDYNKAREESFFNAFDND